MSRVDPKQATIFIVVLLFLASGINSLKVSYEQANISQAPVSYSTSPARQPSGVERPAYTPRNVAQPAATWKRDPADEAAEAARLKAEQEKLAAANAAAEHAKFLTRYLNPGFHRKPGVTSLALAAASESGEFNPAISGAISARLNSGTVEVTYDLFTPEFVSDGLFADAFKGSRTDLARLELANSVDRLLLAREAVDYTTNASLNHVISAHLRLNLVEFPVDGHGPQRSVEFLANGAGFKPDEARSMAEERLLKQIESDTHFFTNQNPQDVK